MPNLGPLPAEAPPHLNAPSVYVVPPPAEGPPWWVEAIAASAGRVSIVDVILLAALAALALTHGRRWLQTYIGTEGREALNAIKRHEGQCTDKYGEIERRLDTLEREGREARREGQERMDLLRRIERKVAGGPWAAKK